MDGEERHEGIMAGGEGTSNRGKSKSMDRMRNPLSSEKLWEGNDSALHWRKSSGL